MNGWKRDALPQRKAAESGGADCACRQISVSDVYVEIG
jgi:hypothetical protein